VNIPEGEFSRQWDLLGWGGVAVRTEVSAQTGTTDVTPLLVLYVFLLLRTVHPGQRSQTVIVVAIEAGVHNTSVWSLRSLRITYLGRYKTSSTGFIASITAHLLP